MGFIAVLPQPEIAQAGGGRRTGPPLPATSKPATCFENSANHKARRRRSPFLVISTTTTGTSVLSGAELNHGTVRPCNVTPPGFWVGSSSVCTFTLAGGIVSSTNGTLAGLNEQTGGGDCWLATAVEQTPKLNACGVAVKLRASSMPKPS